MSKYKFNDFQRYAIYTTHEYKCYMCKKPLDLKTMQIDHVLPENLLENPEQLTNTLNDYGLSKDFNLNDFENWLPSCASCNNFKRTSVFMPTPIIQRHLAQAIKLAPTAREFSKRGASNRQISKALTTLAAIPDDAELNDEQTEVFIKLLEQYSNDKRIIERIKLIMLAEDGPVMNYAIEKSASDLRLTPYLTVVSENSHIRIVKGIYGIGYQTKAENPHTSFYCGHCGSHGPWNGARCMSCGMLDDGD